MNLHCVFPPQQETYSYSHNVSQCVTMCDDEYSHFSHPNAADILYV